MRGRRPIAGIAGVLALVVAVVALRGGSDAPRQATIVKASSDSEAPVTAPAHWLPPEDWVYNHWLPFDEGRLERLLGVTRGAIWRHLRDDRNSLAQLAARRGWRDPQRLAARLVAPRAGAVSAEQLALLRSRALRTLTQGHMSQHLLFHSLHQFAIPSEAPAIFGVSDAAFRALRRGEQSPLEIGRLHGRSPARVLELSAAVLRRQVRFGVDSGAMTAGQGRLLLRRQLSQLPRWLAQVRYNGPPPTHRGRLTSPPRDFAANPALTGDGSRVVFEGYEQRLPVALRRGEIGVFARAVGADAGAARNASASGRSRTPRSAYNPTVSDDGRLVAFESAEGNLNFAKRYGRIRIFVTDTARDRTDAIRLPAVAPGVSLSAYNPVISAAGDHVAYQAQRRDGQSAVYVTDLRRDRTELASRRGRAGAGASDGVFDPSISGDGQKVAFTTAASNLGSGDLRRRTQVFVRDLVARTTRLVSRASGRRGAIADDYSADPALSRDGRYVAFSSAAGNLGGGARTTSRIYVRDLLTRRTLRVSGAGFALKPSISADGRRVAYTSIAGGVARVVVRSVRGGGAERLVSRAGGARGAAADAAASDAVISADGRRVAFTSAATNLSAAKPDDRRGVFVRDLRAQTTTLVSAPVPASAVAAPASPAAGARPAPLPSADAGLARPPARSATVSIFDNAFFRERERPTVALRAGGVLTWRWSSQQSHQVTVRRGPATVASPTRTAGTYSVRLERPGTYEFVCSIHAPGMRMRALVR